MFNSCNNVDAVFLELFDLVRIVGHQSHAVMSDVVKDVSCDFVISTVSREIECKVCIEGVKPTVLKIVCLHLSVEANSSPFLSKVQYNSTPFLLDCLERTLKLRATVAAQAPESIACEAF